MGCVEEQGRVGEVKELSDKSGGKKTGEKASRSKGKGLTINEQHRFLYLFPSQRGSSVGSTTPWPYVAYDCSSSYCTNFASMGRCFDIS